MIRTCRVAGCAQMHNAIDSSITSESIKIVFQDAPSL